MPRILALLLMALLLCVGTPPAARAQANEAIYFPATGHFLDDTHGFLGFWQANNGMRLLGLPVTEPFETPNGIQQYFERGRLEANLNPDTQAWQVRPGAVASEYVQQLQLTFAPLRNTSVRHGLFFEETGHSLRAPFLGFWNANRGEALLGRPISEALWERTSGGMRRVQYFENVRIERDPAFLGTPDEFRITDLGRALALLLNLDTAARPNNGAPIYGPAPEQLPDVAPLGVLRTPRPAAVPVRPRAEQPGPVQAPAPRRGGAKLIVVDLSKQWLYAYEGDTLILDAPVSTGRDGMNTPVGTFAVYAKLRSQTMDGVTDGQYWRVPNVPHVMYIVGGVAIHGTYWHNAFGTGARLSHGCINLPLPSAARLYEWAPMGTTVRVQP